MFEKECRILDLKVMRKSSDENELLHAYHKIISIEGSIKSNEEKIQLVCEAITYNIIKTPKEEKKIQQIYKPRLDYLINKVKAQVQNIKFRNQDSSDFHFQKKSVIHLLHKVK